MDGNLKGKKKKRECPLCPFKWGLQEDWRRILSGNVLTGHK